MRATFPTPLSLLELITLIIFGEAGSYEAPHYAVFSSPLPICPSYVLFLV